MAKKDEEVTICPHCGSDLSDAEYVKPFNHSAIISWSGKQMCPNCHYYGFFLTLPRPEFEKMQFPQKQPIKKCSYKNAAKQAARENSGIVLAAAITVLIAIAYMLLTAF